MQFIYLKSLRQMKFTGTTGLQIYTSRNLYIKDIMDVLQTHVHGIEMNYITFWSLLKMDLQLSDLLLFFGRY